MLDTNAQIDILASLVERNDLDRASLLSDERLEPFKSRGIVAAIEYFITIEGKCIKFCIGVDNRFPLSLPITFIQPPDVLGFIPHVEVDDGYVCYLDPEGTLLDYSNPIGILDEAISRSIEVLSAGVRGENHEDFINEIGAYWDKRSKSKITSLVNVNNILRKVFVYHDRQKYVLITDGLDTVVSYLNGAVPSCNGMTRYQALYVPIEAGKTEIADLVHKLLSADPITSIFDRLIRQNISPENQHRLHKLAKEWKNKALVVLSIPLPNGGKTLIGLTFKDPSKPHVDRLTTDPTPISIQRKDPDYLRLRGGSQSQFVDLKVLVIGCGSIGGFIAPALLMSGIQNLTLVDSDKMSPENIFRHYLGKSAIGEHKVEAIKKDLDLRYPYISIKTHTSRIEDLIRENQLKLSEFKLIIIATGSPTIDLYLNRQIHQIDDAPTTVFTWLEPYGLGGHAIICNSERAGCLQCLFQDRLNPFNGELYNRASFAAANQVFGKNDLGCGGTYFSYSALDAQKTAEMAVRLAIQGIVDNNIDNHIVSWKGKANDFIMAGYKTSGRYDLSIDRLSSGDSTYIVSDCSVCGRDRE
jgi:molybdopterin-synthase adenylyltransferase